MTAQDVWYGDRVVAAVERAARIGTGEVVDDAVSDAQSETPVDTGAARASLSRENEGLVVRWGYHVRYGIWIEIGERGRAGVHALRRAADRHYGSLHNRIRMNLR